MSRVSYAMMNPGGEAEMTAAVRTAIDALRRRAVRGGQGRSAGRAGARCSSATRSCTTCCSASTRSSWAGRRSRSRPTARTSCGRRELGPAIVNARPGLRPALHRRARRCRLRGRGPVRDAVTSTTRSRSWSTSAPTPRSCSATGAAARLLVAHRACVRGCADQQRPARGARARSSGCEVDRATLEPRFKVIGCDLWSDDPGFAEATRADGVTGICGSGIIEALAELYLAGIITPTASSTAGWPRALRASAPKGRTFGYLLHAGEPAIVVSQNDVRAIQLAKAALYAGARLLMDRLGVDAGRPGDARRRVRQPHRPAVRDGAGDDPRLPAGQGRLGRQCRRHRRAHRAPEPQGARGDRGGGASGSRRSRPRSSRASRSISWRRWRSRTRPPPTRTSPPPSPCRRAGRVSGRAPVRPAP